MKDSQVYRGASLLKKLTRQQLSDTERTHFPFKEKKQIKKKINDALKLLFLKHENVKHIYVYSIRYDIHPPPFSKNIYC